MNIFSKLLFSALFLSFFLPLQTEAKYINCPTDKPYVVVAKTSVEDSTTGKPDFDPNPMFELSEFCVPGNVGDKVSFQTLVNAHVLSPLDSNKTITEEYISCDSNGDPSWHDSNEPTWEAGKAPFPLEITNTKPVFANACKDRARFKIVGSYIYVMGKYTNPAPYSGKPQILAAHCGAIGASADCKKDVNCDWGGSNYCYPKGDAKLTPATTTVKVNCETVCASLASGCQAACNANVECIYVVNSCKQKASLSAEEQQKLASDAYKDVIKERYPVPENSNFLPNCAYPGTCDDVTDLLVLLINVAKFLFKIIGTAAFAFFVYGGFTMVLSMGNADKVKSGRETLVAAVIGLIIAFSAYVLVDVVLDILHVSNDYRNVGSLDIKK